MISVMDFIMSKDELLVEWEMTLKCNYSCGYCGLLDPKLEVVTDETKLYTFIEMLHNKYPDTEIFLFGGEPFIHPKIEFIINTFLNFNQPFVVQTNFSTHSVKRIKEINKEFNINISIHPTEITIDEMLNNFKQELKVNIYNIDVMYVGKESIKYYNALSKVVNDLTLTPVTDIGCTGYRDALEEYNKIKKNKVYQKIINFEQIERTIDGVTKQRSEIWEDFNNGLHRTFNKPCLYKGRYFLYDPSLNIYNCCYRKTNQGTCLNDVCFLM